MFELKGLHFSFVFAAYPEQICCVAKAHDEHGKPWEAQGERDHLRGLALDSAKRGHKRSCYHVVDVVG